MMVIPKIYSDFYNRASKRMPANLIGTDLVGSGDGLKNWASELLSENGVEIFLSDDDFVFMMHQGYLFWYFRADGTPDPVVFGFNEAEKQRRNFGLLSIFLKGYF